MNLNPIFNWKESKIIMQVAINKSCVTQTLKQSIFTFQKTKMKNFLFTISFIIVLISCDQKDEKFCECLAKSEEFNVMNQAILNGKTDVATVKKAVELKKEKQKICQDYVNMDGEQMLARKKECK